VALDAQAVEAHGTCTFAISHSPGILTLPFKKILILHTAFIGDIVLALPMVQKLRAAYPRASITFIATPRVVPVLENHEAINKILPFDKRGKDEGLGGIFRIAAQIKNAGYDLAVIPHRSLRSALVGFLSRVPVRIGFENGNWSWLMTHTVRYPKDKHEIDRNLALLQPLGIKPAGDEAPHLYPSDEDKKIVDRFLFLYESASTTLKQQPLVALAPGSVWNTKRWIREHFINVGRALTKEGVFVVLLGGKEDTELCDRIANFISGPKVLNATGRLTLLQSAELIRRCSVLVTNDSAPMHLAAGVGTPVVAVFGPTVPAFGFAPRGTRDVVVGVEGLTCRPCSIHGGEKCPIETFVCMKNLKPETVLEKVTATLERVRAGTP
jgi:heptosyltransferase II